MTNMFGQCAQCGGPRHWCYSCGVEVWLSEYCSLKCLHASGRLSCPDCLGWADCDSERCNDKGWIMAPQLSTDEQK